MREPLHCLAFESFSHFQLQDEHNASCSFMLAAQIPPLEPPQRYKEIGKASGFGENFLFLRQNRV